MSHAGADDDVCGVVAQMKWKWKVECTSEGGLYTSHIVKTYLRFPAAVWLVW